MFITEFDYETYTQKNAPDASQIRRGPEAHKRRREAFKARLINHATMEMKLAREMRHVFISYCHENKATVQRLCQALASHDIHIWVDWKNIGAGARWEQAIQQTIHHGDFFIACFSKEANARDKTYMNQQVSVAMDRLRQKPIDKGWFIPVKLNDCEIPDSDIGEGETLRALHSVALHEDWDAGIQRILNSMPCATPKISSTAAKEAAKGEKENDECVLFRSVAGQHYFIPFQEVRWDSTEISLTLRPTSFEHAAFLCSLRKRHHDVLAFAHQEDAAWVKPREVVQSSTQAETVWNITLTEDTTGKAFKYRTEAVNFEELTVDGIAHMRAKRLLLDEKLEAASTSLHQANVFEQMLLEATLRGELSSQYGTRLQALTSPIPNLYRHFRDTPERFKKFAHLMSVLYLKLSNTVEDVLQLEMELLNSVQLQVKFRGRRAQRAVNEAPALLEFAGICPLPHHRN